MIKVSILDGNAVTASHSLGKAGEAPVRIQAVAGGRYILADSRTGVAPEKIIVKRVGKNLHVFNEGESPDQPVLIIEDFFEYEGQLVGMAEDASYYEYISVGEGGRDLAFLTDGEVTSALLQADSASALAFDSGLSSLSGKLSPVAAIGFGVLGLLGVGALGGGGGGGGGGGVNPVAVDKNAPDAPTSVIAGNPDGSITVSGNGQPGDTVNVTFPDGSTGSVVINEDGSYTIDSPAGQPEGEIVVSATDPSGNTSGETTVVYEDSTPPAVPTPTITGNADGSITVSGGGYQPGEVVNVTFPDGNTGSVTVGADGNYTLLSQPGQQNGPVRVEVYDRYGNGPSSANETYTDTTRPNAPTVGFTNNGDGTIQVSATGERGA